MLFGQGIILGKIFGITIRIDYSWFIIFILVTWSLVAGYFPGTYPKFNVVTNILLGLATSFLIFLSVLIHELSHSVVGNRLGVKIRRITLFVFGGAAEMADEPPSPTAEFKMAVVGPFSSFMLSLLSWILFILMRDNQGPAELQAVFQTLAIFNLGVGLFNLLPGYPLDGGRIFRSIVWNQRKDLVEATEVAASLGRFLGVLMIVFGLTIFFVGNVGSGLWLTLIGFFLNFAAGVSVTQTKLRSTFARVKVSDLMTHEVLSVGGDLSVGDLLDHYFLKHKLSGYPVMEEGKLFGMVYVENLVKKTPVRKNAKVLEVAIKLTKKQIVTPSTNALEALKIMGQWKLPSLPVFEKGRLVGIISQTDINYFLTVESLAFE